MTLRTHRSKIGRRLGAIIVRLRQAKGWTRATLARRAGISDTYIRLLELGDNVPTITVLVELASVLGVSPADLVREVTEPEPPA
ncbi:MAG TPA: helix-turn-helix transcriptional regulator [Thermoanaerobaculia bacterium]|nr:helix-turn-helix transcriptional regulator [Thermoanaerobaculia bacterium]